ncbi:hypothetical protein [Saccharopolyspora pogona]|uniref:hypothetical protein n=1 Tax=Saccharopolyspora pogona TaxID=333966 RepID=UPI001683587E|nr:hypothetical protein [Saccharopolyspora pogona]
MSTPPGKQPRPSTPEANQADPAPRPTRRVFSAEYKLAIVAEYGVAGNRVDRKTGASGFSGRDAGLDEQRVVHVVCSRIWAGIDRCWPSASAIRRAVVICSVVNFGVMAVVIRSKASP